jgi:type I restriction enzyme S subunit
MSEAQGRSQIAQTVSANHSRVVMKAGWKTRKLGDVLEIQNGYAFDAKAFTPREGMPLIRIRDLKGGTTTETRFPEAYDKKYLVSAGDLLIGMDGEFGCYEWKGSPALLNQRVCRLQNFASALMPRFLFYGVTSHLKEIEDVTGYATVKHLSSKQILSIDFPLPPLPEQQRIVGILDEAFEGIATANANGGKNLQNARALFESHMHAVFTQRGEGWVEKPLGEICSLITDGKHGDCRNEENSGYYFLSAKDVRRNTLNFEDARQIIKIDFEETHRRTNLKPYDICMVNTGATIGKLALAPDDPRTLKATFQKSVAVIKPISSIINNSYCCYHLRADLTKLVNVSSGSAQKNLLIGDLRRHVVSLPPLEEQESIVLRLDSLSCETQRLESIYQQRLAALEALKKSLLHQAFSGQL